MKGNSSLTFRSKPDHLPTLDGLRGIAVLLVLWFHLPLNSMAQWSQVLIKLLRPGYFGVDIFFVLSGFLITRILLHYRSQGTSLKVFFARRFLRIFPIYYLLLGVMLLLDPSVALLWNALYLSNVYYPLYSHGGEPLHHLWSLSVEEHFYLAWPFLVAMLSPRKSVQVIVMVVMPIAVLSAVVFAFRFEPGKANSLIYESTLTRMLSLSAGGLLAYFEGWLRDHRQAIRIAALTSFVCGGILLLVSKKLLPNEYWLILRLITAAAISTSIVLFAICTRVDSTSGKILSSTPLAHFGKISYGLYLYHHPIYFYILWPWDSPDRTNLQMATAVGLSYITAIVSFYCIESPILALKKRWRADPKQG